jgi:hypothetical protein
MAGEANRKRSRDMAGLDLEVSDDDDTSADEDIPSTLKRIRVKSSAVHLEFTRNLVKLPNGKVEEKSRCNHCNVNYTGKNPTTLIKHLKSKHPSRAVAVARNDEEQRIEINERQEEKSKSGSNLKSAAEALFGGGKRVADQGNKLDRYISVKKVRRSKSLPPRPKVKEEESERLLGYWVGGSTLPINFVEDPNFELFLQSYDIQVKDKIIPIISLK